jgi:hypothetical protein
MGESWARSGSHVGRELVLGGFASTIALVFLEVFLVCVRRLTLALEIIRMVLLLNLVNVLKSVS